jgi:hypothetical protein
MQRTSGKASVAVLQVDFDLLTRTDEEAKLEWGVILGSAILDNCTDSMIPCTGSQARKEFDEVINSGAVTFSSAVAKQSRCVEDMPTLEAVRIYLGLSLFGSVPGQSIYIRFICVLGPRFSGPF